LEVGVFSGRVVALPDQRSRRVKLEDGDFGFRVRGRDSVAYLAPDNVAAVCCLPDRVGCAVLTVRVGEYVRPL
jgi:hypothetical protein